MVYLCQYLPQTNVVVVQVVDRRLPDYHSQSRVWLADPYRVLVEDHSELGIEFLRILASLVTRMKKLVVALATGADLAWKAEAVPLRVLQEIRMDCCSAALHPFVEVPKLAVDYIPLTRDRHPSDSSDRQVS